MDDEIITLDDLRKARNDEWHFYKAALHTLKNSPIGDEGVIVTQSEATQHLDRFKTLQRMIEEFG